MCLLCFQKQSMLSKITVTSKLLVDKPKQNRLPLTCFFYSYNIFLRLNTFQYFLSETETTPTVPPTAAFGPVITFNNPSSTTGSSPEFTWRSSEQANFECSFDGGRFESCRSGMNGRWSKQNVPDGSHSLLVRGTDNLGNVGRSTKHSWIIGKIFYFKDHEHCI